MAWLESAGGTFRIGSRLGGWKHPLALNTTVLMHELGHLLGYEHDAGGLMAESLAAGTRPTLVAADGLFAEPSPTRRR